MYKDEYIRKAPLFAELDERYIETLAHYCEERHFHAGQLIVRQGAQEVYELGLYVIADGVVRIVHHTADGEERLLAQLMPGDCFGEMSVIDGEPRSASALAEEDTTCLMLSAVDFREALRSQPQIAVNLLRMLSKRLRLANEAPLD